MKNTLLTLPLVLLTALAACGSDSANVSSCINACHRAANLCGVSASDAECAESCEDFKDLDADEREIADDILDECVTQQNSCEGIQTCILDAAQSLIGSL